ncbi:DUF6046 domain-containing protein [Ancylomarina sp. DW003]|nr:DUF6046 domain-containing protein [Ancylomarina sp. DW003]MDE5424027.1 DUF6046 domain-containing protein [Ancylomarina sp. DW003]
MGKFTIDLANRFQNAFGFVAKNALGKTEGIGFSNSGLYHNINFFDGKTEEFEVLELIQSGTEGGSVLRFGAFPFIGGNYGILEDTGIDKPTKKSLSGDTDWFAPPPILSFSRGKNIKTTAINGSDGEVIESYGLKSWDIQMQGLIIDMNKHHYPADKLKKIREVFELGTQFNVESSIFAELDISCLYFTKLSGLSGVEGYEDTWKYTLSAKSIKPIEFSLKETK